MYFKTLFAFLSTLLFWVGACSPSPEKVKLRYQLMLEKGTSYPPNVAVYAGGKRIAFLSKKPGKVNKRHTSGIIARKGNRLLSKDALSLRWVSPCGPRTSLLTFANSRFKDAEKRTLKRPGAATVISVSVREKKAQNWPSSNPAYFFVDYGDGSKPVKVGEWKLEKPKDKVAAEVYGLSCSKNHEVRIGEKSIGPLNDPNAKFVFIGQPGTCYLLQKRIYTTYNLSTPAPTRLQGGKVYVLSAFVDYFLRKAPKKIRVRKGERFEKRYSLTKTPCGS